MAIKIEYDRICIGSFVLCEDGNGVAFDGKACANEYVDTRSPMVGTTAAFLSGGHCNPTTFNNILKFPFASPSISVTDTGDLTQSRGFHSGGSSSTHGYSMGGATTPGATNGQTDVADKFPFASGGNASDVGEVNCVTSSGGHSSTEAIYQSGGRRFPTGTSTSIHKISTSSDSITSSTRMASVDRRDGHGSNSSDTHGYLVGGYQSPPVTPGVRSDYDKFPFAEDTSCVTLVGSATQTLGSIDTAVTGVSDVVNGQGYFTYGYPPTLTTYVRFPFASDTNASSVGTVTPGQHYNKAGAQSETTGFFMAGYCGSTGTVLSEVHSFPFASDTSITDVGSIGGRNRAAGHQD